MTANVRTITGYTAGGKLHWEMSEFFQGAYCSADSGNTCTPVQYLSGTPLVGEFSGLSVLTVALWFAPSPTTVLAFSQGSLIATEWIRGNDGKWGAPSPEDLSFALVANPLRKYGGVRPAYDIDEPTPDSQYEVLDIAIEYDGVADFPDNPFNLLALANALAGSQYVHIDGYEDIDFENSEKLIWKDGNTTYVLIRNKNIPLLEPLRELGLGALADTINGPLKAIIDSAYDRDYSGLVNPDRHGTALQQYSSLRADLPKVNQVAAASPDAAHRSSVASEPAQESSDAEQQVADSSSTFASGEPTAENSRAATEADDQQSVDSETETSTADADSEAEAEAEAVTADVDESLDIEDSTTDVDENLDIVSDDIESDLERQDDDTAAEDERSSNSVSNGFESGSDSDETESQREGEADGPDSESAASSGGSDSTSGSSAE